MNLLIIIRLVVHKSSQSVASQCRYARKVTVRCSSQSSTDSYAVLLLCMFTADAVTAQLTLTQYGHHIRQLTCDSSYSHISDLICRLIATDKLAQNSSWLYFHRQPDSKFWTRNTDLLFEFSNYLAEFQRYSVWQTERQTGNADRYMYYSWPRSANNTMCYTGRRPVPCRSHGRLRP